MKFSVLFLSTYISFALAAPAPIGNTNFILADVTKRPAPPDVKNLFKRGSINSQLFNQLSFYQIDLHVGTPAQKLSALLDTGSSDMWFFSKASGTNGVQTFDPSQSYSWHNNYSDFQIGYVSGSASGTWGTDDVSISGAPIKHQSFAIVTSGSGLTGIPGLIGVGLPALESTNVNGGFFSNRRTYSNVPLSLFEQGHITTPTYSLFLDNIDAKAGSILFGAIDHSKYTGQLYSVPRVHKSRFNINIDAVMSNGKNLGSVGGATLDSGTTLGSLPDKIAISLAQSLGLMQDYNSGVYAAPKAQVNLKTPVTFSISGIKFDMTAKDLLIDSAKLGDPFPPGMYVLGFIPASSTQNQIILGDVFLRNFYIVYDLANPQIGIAMANTNGNETARMEAITSSTIPQAKVVANTPNTVPKNSNNPYGLFDPFHSIFGDGGDYSIFDEEFTIDGENFPEEDTFKKDDKNGVKGDSSKDVKDDTEDGIEYTNNGTVKYTTNKP